MKDYCTQNAGDCGSCSLVSYNLDCAGNPVDDALEQDELELSPPAGWSFQLSGLVTFE